MKKYACTILYKSNDEQQLFKLLAKAIKILGFEPNYMTILFDEFTEPIHDAEFDENDLFKFLEKIPSSITIKSSMYNESNSSDFFSFSLRTGTDEHFTLQTCSLSWLNKNLDFLISSEEFKWYLAQEKLQYCYCYDQYDCYEQSDKGRINPGFNSRNMQKETSREFIIYDVDTSEHWGKVVSSRGLSFMAAPLMWYGEGFYEIITRDEFLKFKYSVLVKNSSFNLVYIKLFDLYEEPTKKENRSKQKEFWDFFDLQNKIKQYENKNPIDAIAWLKARAAQKKQKRKR